MANCINLSSISAATNCVDYDNRGGILAKILVCYHAAVADFPTLPGSAEGGMTLENAGKWSGEITMKTGEKMVEIPFIEGEGEIKVSPSGEVGARCAHYELDIMRTKINAQTFGLLNAFKDADLVIIAVDANGIKYLLGDELVPAKMIDGDGATSGRARTDRNSITFNFEYYGQRFLVYDGEIESLKSEAGA